MSNTEIILPLDSPSDTLTAAPATKNRGGRPNKDLTPQEKEVIERMARQGITQRIIAKSYNIDPKTLRKYCTSELKRAGHTRNLDVLDTLFELATDKHHSSATIFWTKTRCGYLFADEAEPPVNTAPEPVIQPTPVPQPKPPKATPAAEPEPKDWSNIDLDFYNNDGEPNAEY
jgi:DNA-binding CsgD family transcriptional regulator